MLPYLAGVAVLGAVVAVLRRPELGAFGLLFLLFSLLSDLYSPPDWRLSANQLAVALVLGSLVLHRLVLQRRALLADRALGWMLAYGGAMALSALAAYDRLTALAATVAYLRDVVVAFLLVNLLVTPAGLRLGSWSLVAAGVFLAAASVFGALTGNDLDGLSSFTIYDAGSATAIRFEGPRGLDSNYFAQALVIPLALALYRAWAERGRLPRLAALGSVSLLGIAITWTFSRGGFLAVLAVLGLATARHHAQPARLLVLGLALVPIALAAPVLYWDRLAETAQYTLEAASGGLGPDYPPRKPAPDRPQSNRAPGSVAVSRSGTAAPDSVVQVSSGDSADVGATGQASGAAPPKPTDKPRPCAADFVDGEPEPGEEVEFVELPDNYELGPCPGAAPPAAPTDAEPAPADPAAPSVAAEPLGADDTALWPDDSVENRSWVWRLGARMFLDHPLTGVGRGNYYLALPAYLDPRLSPRRPGPHSTPIHIAAETGLIGLAVFVATVVVAVAGLRGAKRRFEQAGFGREALLLEAIEVAIYGYLVASLFLHDNTYQRFFWLLIGLAAAARQVAARLALGPPAPRRPTAPP